MPSNRSDSFDTEFRVCRLHRHISTYLAALFSLPVTRSNGERLSHEEVVNQLDNDTVQYEVNLGVNGAFAETVRVTIRVEVAQYDSAISWLKDLMYGAEFTKDRFVLFLYLICCFVCAFIFVHAEILFRV